MADLDEFLLRELRLESLHQPRGRLAGRVRDHVQLDGIHRGSLLPHRLSIVGLAHWDDVESHRRAKGEMDAEWQTLGRAAGTAGVGVNRVRVAPGMLPTPPHSHGASEEVYYVLGGSGLAWQDGEVHRDPPAATASSSAPTTSSTRSSPAPDGLDFLVFRHPPSDRGRLASAFTRDPDRLAVDRGP